MNDTAKAKQTAKKSTHAKPERGKPMNLYLHPEDQDRIRTLSAWLAGQGFRVSDSQVVKAALRSAQTNKELLKAFESTKDSDRRFKHGK